MKPSEFKLKLSFYEPISHLSDEQLGRLFRALYAYQLGEDADVADDIKVAYLFFIGDFKEQEAKKARRKLKKEAIEISETAVIPDNKELSEPADPPIEPDSEMTCASLGSDISLELDKAVNSSVVPKLLKKRRLILKPCHSKRRRSKHHSRLPANYYSSH